MFKGSKYAWIITISIVIITFCNVGIVLNTSALYMAPVLETHPDWTATAYAVVFTAMSMAAFASLLIAGPLVAKIGCRNSMIFVVTCLVAMQVLLGTSDNIIVFYIAYGLFGFVLYIEAMIIPPILVNNWFAKRQGTMLGFNTAAMGLGAVIFAPLISNWITNYGYKTSYLICAGVIAVLGGGASLLIKDKPDEGTSRLYADETEQSAGGEGAAATGYSFAEALKTKEFWFIAIAMFLIQAPFMSYVAVMSNFVINIGMAMATSAIIIVVYNIAQTISGLVSGMLIDKVGPKPVLYGGVVLFLISCVMGYYAETLGVNSLWGWAVLMGLRAGVFVAAVAILTLNVFGTKAYGKILSIVMLLMALANLPTPLYNAVFDATNSYQGTFLPSMAVSFIGMLLLLFTSVKKEAPAKASAMD